MAESMRRTRGSSPLTRGKRLKLVWRHDEPRLIPAHAGKTGRFAVWRFTARAHPRSRGENYVGVVVAGVLPGSSPLTRGKPERIISARLGNRLIPAHAGKTCPCGGCHVPTWAHPRSRGENCSPATGASTWGGSSPLTRGKRLCEQPE